MTLKILKEILLKYIRYFISIIFGPFILYFQNKKGGLFYIVVFALILCFLPAESECMSSMSSSADSNVAKEGSFSALYGKSKPHNKRFRLTGLVEFKYTGYNIESGNNNTKSNNSRHIFEQRYKLGILGYIYDPRFALFSAYLTYTHSKTTSKDYSGYSQSSKSIDYELSANFFPKRPINISAFALKSTYSFQGTTLSGKNAVSNFYGIQLVSSYKRLPNFTFGYNHWDYSSDRISGRRLYDEFDDAGGLIIERKNVTDKYSTDRFTFQTKGFLKPINTKYTLGCDYSIHSSPYRKFNSEYIKASAITFLKKDNSVWSSFQYSAIDTSKLLDIATTIRLSPIFERLYHSYNLEYMASETESNKSDAYTLAAYWRYKLSNKIFARLDLRYRFGTRDGANENSYNVNASINYGKLIKGFDFTSSYAISIGDEEQIGQFRYIQNSLSLGLSTRKIRWARIYSNYRFRYITFEYNPQSGNSETDIKKSKQFNEMEHMLILGITGKGLLRTNWTLEGETRYVNASDEKTSAWTTVWAGEKQWGQKVTEYTVRGDLRYPLWRRCTISFRASYSTGEVDSVKIGKYYYEGRLRYNITRDINLLAWWRNEWSNNGWLNNNALYNAYAFDIKTRYYEIDLYYAWRAVYLSLELMSTRTEEGTAVTEARRANIILKRPF